MKNTAIKIGNRNIGENNPVFIIAEVSANHLQKYDLAVKTIEAAKKAGADAVKVQTYTPDTITLDCDNGYFRIKQGTLWDGTTLYKLYQQAYTPWAWQPKLQKVAEDLGLIFFSSPFDKTAVDFLEGINVPAYKVASFEIMDIPLIKYIASQQKPIIVSSGVATMTDLEMFFDTCKKVGNNNIILLKCTSAYPANPEDMNLKTIADMQKRFHSIVGLSDHTTGISAPIAAVTLGAKVIEKHIILDRTLGGPDAPFSLEPDQFKTLTDSIRETEKMLGTINYDLTINQDLKEKFSRSLFIVEDTKKGDLITEKNVRSIRPGYGLHPKYYNSVMGKKLIKDSQKGTPLTMDLIE